MNQSERPDPIREVEQFLSVDELEKSRKITFETTFRGVVNLLSPFGAEASAMRAILSVPNEDLGDDLSIVMDARQRINGSYFESLSRQIYVQFIGIIDQVNRETLMESDNQYEARLNRSAATCSVSLNFREIALIGEKNLERLDLPQQPDVDLDICSAILGWSVYVGRNFLELNKAFVDAGGRDNHDIRGKYEDFVNANWQHFTMLGGDPFPWDPDYFQK